MASTREMRLRIRSVKNLSQVTKALETVSASRVRKAIQAHNSSKPYAEKAWKVLVHLARQPGHNALHPLLADRPTVKKALVILVTSDRGLAGSYNANIFRHALHEFNQKPYPVDFVAVGKKGRDLLLRRRKNVIAEFSDLPSPPLYKEVAPITSLVIEDFEKGVYDEVYICYTQFINMMRYEPVTRRLLPLKILYKDEIPNPNVLDATHRTHSVFTFEPDEGEVLNNIVPHFTGIQIFQAILSAQTSEHAARMIAMRNATESAQDLIQSLQLEYNKLRQTLITNEMLDIAGGANALAQENE